MPILNSSQPALPSNNKRSSVPVGLAPPNEVEAKPERSLPGLAHRVSSVVRVVLYCEAYAADC